MGYGGRGYLGENIPNIIAQTKMYSGAVGMNLVDPTGAFKIGASWATGWSLGYAATPGTLYYANFDASLSNNKYTSTNEVRPLTLRTNVIIKY